MSKKKKTLVAAFVVLGMVALGMGAFVYAKYVSTVTGTGTAQVAKWEFRTANEGKTDLIKCELGKTYNATTLANGKIAPGTEGKCTIKVSNGEGQVGVNYTIAVAASGKPTNLKFYTDEAHTTALPTTGVTGHINAGVTTPDEKVIYWLWPYETAGGDATDTSEGENVDSMTIDFAITGVQVQPEVQQP